MSLSWRWYEASFDLGCKAARREIVSIRILRRLWVRSDGGTGSNRECLRAGLWTLPSATSLFWFMVRVHQFLCLRLSAPRVFPLVLGVPAGRLPVFPSFLSFPFPSCLPSVLPVLFFSTFSPPFLPFPLAVVFEFNIFLCASTPSITHS